MAGGMAFVNTSSSAKLEVEPLLGSVLWYRRVGVFINVRGRCDSGARRQHRIPDKAPTTDLGKARFGYHSNTKERQVRSEAAEEQNRRRKAIVICDGD